MFRNLTDFIRFAHLKSLEPLQTQVFAKIRRTTTHIFYNDILVKCQKQFTNIRRILSKISQNYAICAKYCKCNQALPSFLGIMLKMQDEMYV